MNETKRFKLYEHIIVEKYERFLKVYKYVFSFFIKLRLDGKVPK